MKLSCKIEDVFSASGYFLNGKAIDYLGFPGVNKFQTVIKYNRPLVNGTVNSQGAELLIRVSNFDHRFSGIVGGITMGLPEQMQNAEAERSVQGPFPDRGISDHRHLFSGLVPDPVGTLQALLFILLPADGSAGGHDP